MPMNREQKAEMAVRWRRAFLQTYDVIAKDFSDVRDGRPARRAEVIDMVLDANFAESYGGDREAVAAFYATFPRSEQMRRWLAKHVFTWAWYE